MLREARDNSEYFKVAYWIEERDHIRTVLVYCASPWPSPSNKRVNSNTWLVLALRFFHKINKQGVKGSKRSLTPPFIRNIFKQPNARNMTDGYKTVGVHINKKIQSPRRSGQARIGTGYPGGGHTKPEKGPNRPPLKHRVPGGGPQKAREGPARHGPASPTRRGGGSQTRSGYK